MAVNRSDFRALPLSREYHAIATIAGQLRERGRKVTRSAVATLLGGILAIVAVIGIVIISAIGRPVPSSLSDLAFLAGAWYFATSTAAVAANRTRQGANADE